MIRVLTLLCLVYLIHALTPAEYEDQRCALFKKDAAFHFDADVVLNSKEKTVDKILDGHRTALLDIYAQHRFIFATNFRQIIPQIENNIIFKLLSPMPKGGILHTHAIGDAMWLIKEGTYDTRCWINVGTVKVNGILPGYFFYSDSRPDQPTGVIWKRVVDLRASSSNPEAFDLALFQTTQFYTPPSDVAEDDMWVIFDDTIRLSSTLAADDAIWRRWVKHSLGVLYNDGITHFEMRGFMNYITNSTTYEPTYNDKEITQIWLDIIDEFNRETGGPNITVRFIVSVLRSITPEKMNQALMSTVALQNDSSIGSYIVGFDIVDEEDRFFSLKYYLDSWLMIQQYLADRGLPPMKFYFHAGETTRDKRISENLYDAILLNTTRIGHGFALRNYPFLMDEVKKRGIAIEVSPISNQMLRLLDDMRDHPVSAFLNAGLPVAISSDDPMIYGNHGLSYDFWAGYLSWNISLSGLKKLGQNSLTYSALPDEERAFKLAEFNKLWNKWIDWVLRTGYKLL